MLSKEEANRTALWEEQYKLCKKIANLRRYNNGISKEM